MPQLAKGDRVRFTSQFLQSTGQYTGPDKPASYGPFARGVVDRIDRPTKAWALAYVLWDDGQEGGVNVVNLEKTR